MANNQANPSDLAAVLERLRHDLEQHKAERVEREEQREAERAERDRLLTEGLQALQVGIDNLGQRTDRHDERIDRGAFNRHGSS